MIEIYKLEKTIKNNKKHRKIQKNIEKIWRMKALSKVKVIGKIKIRLMKGLRNVKVR